MLSQQKYTNVKPWNWKLQKNYVFVFKTTILKWKLRKKGRWNLRNLVRDRLNHSPENWRDPGWGVEFIEVDCSDEGSST